MITFNKLNVGYGGCTILSGLSGEIKRGDLIALMGINGVGKSCFLKTLTGLNPLIEGEITLNEKSYSMLSEIELAKSLAVVLTDKIQADFLRVQELIALGRSPYTNFWGDFSPEDDKVMGEIGTLLGLKPLYERYFSDLSDGQKQKVLLARALVQSPDYLFLDEPTTYLDIPSKIELMKSLKFIASEKNTGVFFSTHDLNLVEKYVDQIWLIDSEGILHKKSPEEMNQSGLLKKNFNI